MEDGEGWCGWTLEVRRIAREQDVNDGQAQSDGQLMWSTEIAVDYCPFCGMNLDEIRIPS